MNMAQWLGQLIGEAIRPILREIVYDAVTELLTNRAEISKPDADLQRMWTDGMHTSDPDSKGRSMPYQPYS
jgi:hypothetical protein